MSKPARAFALLVLWAAPAWSETSDQNRLNAALLEWGVANCNPPEVSAKLFGLATMTINGSTAEEMTVAREFVRKRIAETFASTEAACADIMPRFQAKPK